MKHKFGNKKLNKPTDQRLALIKGLVVNLFENNSIKTIIQELKRLRSMLKIVNDS